MQPGWARVEALKRFSGPIQHMHTVGRTSLRVERGELIMMRLRAAEAAEARGDVRIIERVAGRSTKVVAGAAETKKDETSAADKSDSRKREWTKTRAKKARKRSTSRG